MSKLFIQDLIKSGTRLELKDFFKVIHDQFYNEIDISFMDYFLTLTEHEGEYIVHHYRLVDYGVMSSKRSSDVKKRLDALGLIENNDYHLRDIQQMVRPQGGGKQNKVYMLTPEAFKTCLMRAQRRSKQTIDPVAYSKYYLLLEKIYKLYTDYEKQLLVHTIQEQGQALEQKNQALEQKNQALEQKDQALEQKNHYIQEQERFVVRLNEMLIDNTKLPKTQVVYIATSDNYAQQNRFKVGGVESLDKLGPRLSVYNSRSAQGDEFYYAEWYMVNNYREIENRLKSLLSRFKDKKSKEIYVLHYTKLEYITSYLVDHSNEETDLVNEHLAEFIASLDKNQIRPLVPKMKPLKKVKVSVSNVGYLDLNLVIEGNHYKDIEHKMEDYFKNLDPRTLNVTSKTAFDDMGVKKKRLELFTLLKDIGEKIRPDVHVKKR